MANAQFSKPVRSPSGWDEVLKAHFKKESAKIRTTIPAKVIEVNYESGLVLVQPLIRTWWEKLRSEVTMWPLEGIPIIFSSAKRGVARITLPVAKGDVGLVLFADRHTENFLGSTGDEVVDSGSMTTLGIDGYMNVIGFIPEVFTESTKQSFDSDNVVIEHGEVSIKLHEDGDCTISNGNGSFKLQADGVVNINGFIINTDGSIETPVKLTTPSIILDGKEQKDHTHESGAYVDGESRPVSGTSGVQP